MSSLYHLNGVNTPKTSKTSANITKAELSDVSQDPHNHAVLHPITTTSQKLSGQKSPEEIRFFLYRYPKYLALIHWLLSGGSFNHYCREFLTRKERRIALKFLCDQLGGQTGLSEGAVERATLHHIKLNFDRLLEIFPHLVHFTFGGAAGAQGSRKEGAVALKPPFSLIYSNARAPFHFSDLDNTETTNRAAAARAAAVSSLSLPFDKFTSFEDFVECHLPIGPPTAVRALNRCLRGVNEWVGIAPQKISAEFAKFERFNLLKGRLREELTVSEFATWLYEALERQKTKTKGESKDEQRQSTEHNPFE